MLIAPIRQKVEMEQKFHLFLLRKNERNGKLMGLNDLDKIIEAKRLISGVRDSMVMMENSLFRETQDNVYYILESVLEQAASLLDEVAEGKVAESKQAESQPKEN